MKRVKITESQYRILTKQGLINEKHHAIRDTNLWDKVEKTAKYLIDNAHDIYRLYNKGFRPNLPEDLLNVDFRNDEHCAYTPKYNSISVGLELIMDCAGNNDVRRLASLIYHEMGHQTNVTKSGQATSEINKDFSHPFWFSLDQELYDYACETLYKFYTRELKARCFEATMFLKQSKTFPTLEEYYNNRCTDITEMRKFIDVLEKAAQEGPKGKNSSLITGLASEMNHMKVGNTHAPINPSFQSQAKMVLGWFHRQFDWFKKRVDKIYYDFKAGITESTVLDEVRYIDTTADYNRYYGSRSKKDPMDAWKQEPIKNTDTIRVYHGCDLKTAVLIAKQGVSGQQWTPRKYSYEQGMNPVGLFVTTDFEKVKEFSNPFGGGKDKNASVIIEFTARATDLDTPVWNGSDSYFGQYSNPQPFRNKTERDAQKQQYNDNARNSQYDYIRNSDNPALAKNIFDNNEHQALFIGNLNPNMIKRFWVKKFEGRVAQEQRYTPMNRQQFLKQYGDTEFYSYRDRQSGKEVYKPLQNNKIYLPNDDFKGFEDWARRYINKEKDDNIRAFERQLKFYNGESGLFKHYVETSKELFDHGHWDYFSETMWPKQLRQLLGDEKYKELFDNFDIGSGNKNTNENVNETFKLDMDPFSIWEHKFMGYVDSAIKYADSIIGPLGLKVEINADYNFRGNGQRWLAAYQRRSGQIKNNIILIALNLGLFYKIMKQKGIADDDFNIEAQAKITIGHEVGHGLVDWLRFKTEGQKIPKNTPLGNVLSWSHSQEEEGVEEFGKSFFTNATGVYDSKLEQAVYSISSN